jgi:hypothetical protein
MSNCWAFLAASPPANDAMKLSNNLNFIHQIMLCIKSMYQIILQMTTLRESLHFKWRDTCNENARLFVYDFLKAFARILIILSKNIFITKNRQSRRVCDPYGATTSPRTRRFGSVRHYESPDGPCACFCATYIVVVVFKHKKLQVYARKTPQSEISACP